MAESPSDTKQHKRRSYSPEFIANALAMVKANGDNVFKTAKELKIPRLTLREWQKNGRRVTPEVTALQHENEQNMAQRYERAAGLYLEHATDPLTIQATSGLDAMKASAIATDKSRLLLGQPTAISTSVMSEDERRLRVAELLARIAERRDSRAQQPPAIDVKPLQVSG